MAIEKSTTLTAKEKCNSYHLHSADVLLLLHVDVSQIQPDVADVRSGLPHLRKHVAGITEVAFVGKDGTCTGSSLVLTFGRLISGKTFWAEGDDGPMPFAA